MTTAEQTRPKVRIYRDVVDKSDWGPGPWQLEPDKVQWTDPATGLPCLAVRGPTGAWCGYVGVTAEHPAFGQDQDVWSDVEVHGGLTFASKCQPGPENRVVCHVPEPGQSDHVWWLGFDCAHSWDLSPGIEARTRALRRADPVFDRSLREIEAISTDVLPRDVYRTLLYVRDECKGLAAQLAAIA